ncbi:hypothetical protein L6164_023230 [Bauhinia variegata]|uniref:Uncharacterized protein n=1 Tax=Bauhinia variegata TaxID=167791 RepID=A0ACB9MI76_BAUVA|nr:hypothetical protein L6164_023230 [Bauhinia variegata]
MDQLRQLFLFLLILHLSVSGINSTTFTIENRCDFTVWPVISNMPLRLSIALQKGESMSIQLPRVEKARFWGRTGCSDNSTGSFSCATGDCGTGTIECGGGSGGTAPVTLVEFSLAGPGGLDFFDVSLVDGYNLPLTVVPSTNCTTTGCVVDVNNACPPELVVKSVDGVVVGCNSACTVFNSPQYCCTGNYATPTSCGPTSYSQIFKIACPRAYSYAYDDKTSTLTCSSADYNITFCPTPIASTQPFQSGFSLLTNSILVQ